jgi:hypothetical protein
MTAASAILLRLVRSEQHETGAAGTCPRLLDIEESFELLHLLGDPFNCDPL